jgi:hypothetical protein
MIGTQIEKSIDHVGYGCNYSAQAGEVTPRRLPTTGKSQAGGNDRTRGGLFTPEEGMLTRDLSDDLVPGKWLIK